MDPILAQERLHRAKEAAKEEHQRILATKASMGSSAVLSTPMTSFLTLPNIAILNRIYVGSIQFDVSEAEIQAVFSVYGPIRSVNMMVDTVNKRHKGYGFIEYETPEAAALAQVGMDASQLAGRTIKVGRPSNFPTDLPPGVPRPVPNRIYVGNVHELIQESELKAIFEAFGPLLHCNLVPDPATRQHKGYAYAEFRDVSNAIAAVAALHGFELAGRALKVGRTVVGGPIPPGMSSLEELVAAQKPRVPTAVLRAAQQINAAIVGAPSLPQSRTVLLGNLDDYEQISADQQLLLDLEEDIMEEAQKFGKVLRCKASLSVPLKEVQVTVQYEDPSEAQQCISIMDKRWFGGRQISAICIPDDR
jgi:poly(U)-binding-splicing factor PUF60